MLIPKPSLLLMLSLVVIASAAGIARADVEAFTKARHRLNMAFTIPGQITVIPVKPGDRVKKGDVLIQLEDNEAKAQVDLWNLRANSVVAVAAAQEALKMSQWEEKKLGELVKSNSAAKLEHERSVIQVEIDRQRLKQAEQEKQEAGFELARMKAQHDRYIMKAPLDGVIEILEASPGETVEQLKPVLQMVVTDPLWIDAPVPTSQTLKLKVDDPAWVRTRLPGYTDKAVQGKVIHIGRIADAASDTRLVRIEVPNPGDLPAGVQVMVTFTAPEAMAQHDAKAAERN